VRETGLFVARWFSVAVNITDITNNFATGSFSALMHDQTLAKIEITEGSFQHVMIVQ